MRPNFILFSFIFAAGFVAMSGLVDPAGAANNVINRLEAFVNGSPILLSEVARYRKTVELRSSIDPFFQGTVIAEKGANALDSDIVSFLTDDKLITLQFPIKDQEVEQKISEIINQNKISRESLRAQLAEQGFEYDDYFEFIRIAIAKMYLIDRDIRMRIHISDDDVKNHFFNQLRQASTASLRYRIFVLQVTDRNYKSNADATQTLQRAKQSISAGESFVEVAKRFSDGPNATDGGDLGFLSEDSMTPVIRDEVRKLKVGSVSDVVIAGPGTRMLIRLDDVQGGQEAQFESKKEEIRIALGLIEQKRQITLWLERERSSAHIHLARPPALQP